MRLDRPAGFYSAYFPYVIGLLYAACIASDCPAPMTIVRHCMNLVLPIVFFRGAICTWNDNVDQDFDRNVRRCRHRPIARGAITTSQAHVFTIVQLAISYGLYLKFLATGTPQFILIAGLSLVYCVMKQITYYPSFVLGFPCAFAIPISLQLMGINPVGKHFAPMTALFVSCVLWSVTADTIYAHQDLADDVKAGVKGMAVRFKDSTKFVTSVLLICQIILLALCGLWSDFGVIYFVGTVAGTAIAQGYVIYKVDLKSPESCGAWFYNQFWIAGAGFVLGLAGEYVARLLESS